MLVVVTGTLMTSAAVLIFLHRIRTSGNSAAFTSVFQGGVRFNTYSAL
jgi:hypothetical protein